MTESTTIQGEHVRPNPRAFGFAWRPLQKLLTEHQKLYNQHMEVDGQFRQLKAQISVMDRQQFDALADALRTGDPEPTGADLDKARAELEEVRKRSSALGHALEKLDAEIVATASKHAQEWRREVYAKARERAQAVEDAVHRLKVAQGELYQMSALGEWLDNPRKNFGHSDGPHLLDTFNHQDVRLGEVLDAVKQDAREKAATPDELEKQRWAEMGATAASNPGWVG